VALRSASGTWVAAMMGLATTALAVSILLIVFRHGPKRAYWIGFATFGWLYMLVLVASWTLARIAANDSPLAAHNLPTQQLASVSYHLLYDEAFEKYHASLSGPATGFTGAGQTFSFYFGTTRGDPSGAVNGDIGNHSPDGMSMGFETSGPPMPGMGPTPIAVSSAVPGPPPGPNSTDFVNVAHALWTLLFAVIGGGVAYWLYVTGPGRSERQAAASS